MGTHYPRQTVIAPIGLVTEPNEYGQYPAGALKTALNVVMRRPGKISRAPTRQRNVQPATGAGAVLMKLMPADTGAVYAIVKDDPSANNWAIYADGVAESYVGSTLNAFSSTGRISWAQCASRLLVNGKYGILVRDPVPLSTKWRAAGLPQAQVVQASFGTGSGTPWIDLNQMVGYRVCLARRYSSDYTLRSAPSPSVKIWQSSGGKATVTVQVMVPAGSGVEPGDIIELYRTDILSTTNGNADPGAVFKLVREYALTSADVAGLPATIFIDENQAPLEGTLVTPGRELYTNPGIEGENYANLRPPIAQCLASFKGFCFYGNTTERAQLKMSWPGGVGLVNGARATGVGERSGAGTITNGSAVITGCTPAELVGVKVGQRWAGAPRFTITSSVVAIGTDTITMSTVAVAGLPTTTWVLRDVIEINGVVVPVSSGGMTSVLQGLNGVMEAQCNQTLPVLTGASALIGFEATLMWNYHPFDRAITVRATNGANYSPPLPEIGAAVKTLDPIIKKNRLCWSKEQQPEHVPSVSETFIGFGEIYAINSMRDSIGIWCSDGLFRLSGNGGSLGLGAWQVDYSNSTLLLSAPQASCVYDEHLYGYTNNGVVEVDSANNVRNLTHGVVGNILPGARYRETAGIIVERNETDGEVLLAPGSLDPLIPWTGTFYAYNVQQKAWTQFDLSVNSSLTYLTVIAMHRLPPETLPTGVEAHVLLGGVNNPGGIGSPSYGSWDSVAVFPNGRVEYQPVYGEDPLELKRWMWTDYLFDTASTGTLHAYWNGLEYGTAIALEKLDIGTYVRAGVPREVGLSHSLSPGVMWDQDTTQKNFEGISIAVRQRTNQSKKR